MGKLRFEKKHTDFWTRHTHVSLGNNFKSQGIKSTSFKNSQEEGITLVALIITIIILVILAAISISTAYNTKIVEHAVNGSYNYANQSLRENSIMAETVDLIDSTVEGIGDILNGDGE